MKSTFNFNIGRVSVTMPRNAGGGSFDLENMQMGGEVEYSPTELDALLDNSEKTMSAMGQWIDGKMPGWLERMGNSLDKVRRQACGTQREMRKLDDEAHRQQIMADQKASHDRQREMRAFEAESEKD